MTVRIANWNLDHAKEKWRRKGIDELMAVVGADVWVLTESRDCARPTRDEAFAACAVIRLGDGAALAVYGTVLPWRGSTWRGKASVSAEAFRAALGAQTADWRELRDEAELLGFCVAGDFNQDLSDKPYYWSRGARTSLERALAECRLVATTRDPTDPVRHVTRGAKACIDHICVSQTLAERLIGSAQAWMPRWHGRDVSDHPGVWIEIDGA